MAGSGSAKSWTPVAKRDTTSEAAAVHDAWWLSLSGTERASWWMARNRLFDELRYDLIRQRNPGASEAENAALWTEETYRDSVDPAFLEKVAAAIRSRPATG